MASKHQEKPAIISCLETFLTLSMVGGILLMLLFSLFQDLLIRITATDGEIEAIISSLNWHYTKSAHKGSGQSYVSIEIIYSKSTGIKRANLLHNRLFTTLKEGDKLTILHSSYLPEYAVIKYPLSYYLLVPYFIMFNPSLFCFHHIIPLETINQ